MLYSFGDMLANLRVCVEITLAIFRQRFVEGVEGGVGVEVRHICLCEPRRLRGYEALLLVLQLQIIIRGSVERLVGIILFFLRLVAGRLSFEG